MITIERYYDKWDFDLTHFRHKVYNELGASASIDFSYNELVNKFYNNKFIEEIYKFSNKKWDKTYFDCIEAIKINDQIVGISGAAIHNNSVRILMHRYSLFEFRQIANNYTWHKDGVIDQHLDYAKNINKQAIFFTIYEHNKTLKVFSNYLKKRKSNKNKPLLGKFEYFNKPVLFNNTLQTIFYYKINSNYNFALKEIL